MSAASAAPSAAAASADRSAWLGRFLAERARARAATEVVIGAAPLGLAEVIAVARFFAKVRLAPAARGRMRRSRAVVERLLKTREKVYGVTTGFGPKRDVLIDASEVEALQRNLVRSHACGTGGPLPEDAVRALALLRAATLAVGCSGVRPVIVERLCELLNARVYPLVPSRGSVGASGDLAQLSHLALVLMGEPEGRIYEPTAAERAAEPARAGAAGLVLDPRPAGFVPSTPEALAGRGDGIGPVRLLAKEGLALINGTQGMAALGALVLWDGLETLVASELARALSLEAQQGVRDALDPRIHAVRPVPGQSESAWLLRAATAGSEVLATPLCLPRFDRAIRDLEDGREQLARQAVMPDDEALPLLEDLSARMGAIVADLRAIREDPRGAHEAALAAAGLGTEDLRGGMGLPRSARREVLRAFDDRLAPVRRELLACYQMVLGSALPPGAARAREFLAAAIGEVEQAVPESPPVQDDYSYRCAPQVLGAVRASIDHARAVHEKEFGAVTDNPLVFPPGGGEGEAAGEDDAAIDAWAEALTPEACRDAVVSGGNFHGEPLAFALDLTAIALVEIASISERRVAHLTDGRHSNGLPSLLVERAGLRSGFLIPQYTAAALVSEAKGLAHPASVDSIPTGEGTEDHVSMGLAAAHQGRAALDLVERVVAIELLTACAGARFRGAPKMRLGRGTEPLFALLDAAIPPLDEDRALAFDMDNVLALLRRGEVLDRAATALVGGGA